MPLHQKSQLCHDAKAETARIAGLRSEIDRIDDDLLRLMEERLLKSIELGTLKRREADVRLLLRPPREREILDRLAARATCLSRDSVVQIWRELMAANLKAQQPIELVLYTFHNPVRVTNAARLRFGCAAPITVVGSPAEALDRALRRDAIAIIEHSPLSSWWMELADSGPIALFDALDDDDGSVTALALGRIETDPTSDEDRFSIITETKLRRRVANGEAIRVLAFSGAMRLCVAQRETHGRAVRRKRMGKIS